MSTTAPVRSREQRRDALERANEVRIRRAEFKRQLKAAGVRAGFKAAAAKIQAPDEAFASMKLFDLLMACPKVGRVKANRLLTRAGCSPSKTLAGLSERQRRELALLLSVQVPYTRG